jgi:hypothetical protein
MIIVGVNCCLSVAHLRRRPNCCSLKDLDVVVVVVVVVLQVQVQDGT